MNYYNKVIKYQTKINLIGGDNVYIFKPNGFRLLINKINELKDRFLSEKPDLLEKELEIITWEDYDEAKPMMDMLNAYFPRFSDIWKKVYNYIALETQEFYITDYRIFENEDGLPLDGFGILTSIYKEVNKILIDYREMCQNNYRPHSQDKCVNAKGERLPKLLHWPSLDCANDNTPAHRNARGQQVPAGCGLHRKNNCTFHHKDQNQYQIKDNGLLFIDRRGFVTLPNGGHWFNAKPFV